MFLLVKIIILYILSLGFLNANELLDNYLKIFITYKQELYILLALLLVVLLLSFLLKKNKKNKSPNNCDFLYLNKLVKRVEKEYLRDNKYNKNIIQDFKELSLFLEIKSHTIKVVRKNFNLENFVNSIHSELIYKNKDLNIIVKNDISYSIITDKKILNNIFFLMAILQFKEHNLNNAHISIELNYKERKLFLGIEDGLFFNKHMQRVLKDKKLRPFYNLEENFYYGLYLSLLNNLVNLLHGQLIINILNKIYTLKIVLPISIEEKTNNINLLIPDLINKKIKALIICEDKSTANSIAKFLNLYNINSDIIDKKSIKIPDFVKYDLLITNNKFLDSIFSDYLKSIKKYHNIKVVSIESENKKESYKNSLVDDTIKKPIVQSKVYSIVSKLFKSDDSNYNLKKVSLNENKIQKVLIADDELVSRELLKAIIENYGIEVLEATNGEEAIEILEKNENIKLIILDSVMPKMNAYETIKVIRNSKQYNTIPVIIYSSFSLNKLNSIDKIFKLGFDSYLPKPFEIEKLESILLRYLHIKPKVSKDKKDKQKDYEEFLAIYGNSDKMIEKYIKENAFSQLKELLKDLKDISMKIDRKSLYNEIKNLENLLENNSKININTIEPLIKELRTTTSKLTKELNN